MTYLETKLIIKEAEYLIGEFESDEPVRMEKYKKIFYDIYPAKLRSMNIEYIASKINSYYGVYNKGDIVADEDDMPCLITYIDYKHAENLHEVQYHVIYECGITDIICIDAIKEKLESTYNVMHSVDDLLDKWMNVKLHQVNNI